MKCSYILYLIREQELIFLFWILQVVVTDCHEQAGLANRGNRNCKGMRYGNTIYVKTTLYIVTMTFKHGVNICWKTTDLKDDIV